MTKRPPVTAINYRRHHEMINTPAGRFARDAPLVVALAASLRSPTGSG
jgi:hypothetical protein